VSEFLPVKVFLDRRLVFHLEVGEYLFFVKKRYSRVELFHFVKVFEMNHVNITVCNHERFTNERKLFAELSLRKIFMKKSCSLPTRFNVISLCHLQLFFFS